MKKNIPIFVTHYGCPNQCIFCNQKKISGAKQALDITECKAILEQATKMGYSPQETEIAFFGGSFTGIPVEQQRKYLETARQYQDYFHGIRLSTRPDYITVPALELLREYPVTTIELGVQSMVDSVLLKNKRGMTQLDTFNAVKLIRNYPFSLGLQMMVSMYGSDSEKDLETAEKIIALKPDFVRIYPTVVLEDTELFQLYQSGEYKTNSLEDTVELTAKLYQKFMEANIPVIRVGLMASEEINSKKIIGAYHEAFGELVQNEIYFQRFEEQLKEKETVGKRLLIHCGRQAVSKVAGQKRKNIYRLYQTYAFRDIKIVPEENREPFWFSFTIEA